ncbi:MAG: hypothetical protein HRT47_03525 [Candidatus Caenarcaniphilales bacterium]|nr:hypothetical protein [Candidatus Caenarcaniphilales bacterium]
MKVLGRRPEETVAPAASANNFAANSIVSGPNSIQSLDPSARLNGANIAKAEAPKKGFFAKILDSIKFPWFKKKEEQEVTANNEPAIPLPQNIVYLPTDFDNVIALKNDDKRFKKEDFLKMGLPKEFLPLSHTMNHKGEELEILENIAWQQLAYDLYQGFAFEQNKQGELEPKILNNRFATVVVTRNPHERAAAKLDTLDSPILNTLKPTMIGREQLGAKEEVNDPKLKEYSPNKGRFGFFGRLKYGLKMLFTKPGKFFKSIQKYGLKQATEKPPSKWIPYIMPKSEFKDAQGNLKSAYVPVLLDDTLENNGGNNHKDGFQPAYLNELQDPKKFIEATITSGIDKDTGKFNPRKTRFYQEILKQLILPMENEGIDAFLKSKNTNLPDTEVNAVVEFKRTHTSDTLKESGMPYPWQPIENFKAQGGYQQEFLQSVKMSDLKAIAA